MYTSSDDNDDGYYDNYTTLGTFIKVFLEQINYSISRLFTLIISLSAPPSISNNINNSKDDALPMLQSPASTTSPEGALSSRSEVSGDN